MKLLLLILMVLFTSLCLAQDGSTVKKYYTAVRVNPHAPEIDGRCSDPVWQNIAAGDGFLQSEPTEGVAPSEKTRFKICYDDKNIYVLIEALDSQPEKIEARLARRDRVRDSDLVGVLFDSYCDRRTAFEFSLNAAGVKRDAVWANDEDDDDESWDPVWDGQVTRNDSGWVAEMRIPFSQLRYSAGHTEPWGLDVYRYLHRNQEMIHWQLIPKDAAGFASAFGRLQGLENLPSPRRIELLPYTVSSLHRFEKEEGNPFADGSNLKGAGGLDGKFGLGGNLTVDFTVNPDFGQVEADPSEVNLSAFETFFEEKRPFFVEGKNIYEFPLGFGDGGFARETLFYSRRIGRPPHHEPETESDDEYVDVPDQTSILGAAKLSGKTASGWSVGVLDALTAQEMAKIDKNGDRHEEVAEPLTNYFVGRLQKDFNRGNTTVGGMATATNRNIDKPYLDFINRSAYTGGIDVGHQWSDKTYFANLKLAGSHVRGHPDALLEVQTASARYFQRPDANYLTLDSSRTSLSGHGGAFSIGKQGRGHWRYAVGGIWRSPGLELNDVGFLQSADRIMQYFWVGYRIYNPVAFFRRAGINFNQWNGWNFGGEKIFDGGNVNLNMQFTNYWGMWMGINREGGGISATQLRGGPAMREEGGWNNWFGFYSDSRKFWQIEAGGFSHRNDDGITRVHNLRLELELKPSRNIRFSLRPFYNIRLDNLQYLDTIEKNNSEKYFLARLDQKTLGIVIRLNYSITPNLTVQFYGQPFISAGRYSQYKRVTRPRAANYDDRFIEYKDSQVTTDLDDEVVRIDENGDQQTDYTLDYPDFNFKEFRSNLVIRWEYRPGSQLYLVWSQDRSDADSFGDFSLKRDMKDLFGLFPDNIFLIKFNHWFSI